MLDSYVEIDLDKIGANAHAITQKYSDYKYFIAVLKGDGYGHGMEVANEMYKNGINYFAVSSLEEAQSFRKVNKDAPLLCLHPVHLSRIEEAKRRDHRKLGRELGLFAIMEEGPGFPFFLPKGLDSGRGSPCCIVCEGPSASVHAGVM